MPDDRPAEVETSQREQFKKAARELECDDDEDRFKDRLGNLVGPK